MLLLLILSLLLLEANAWFGYGRNFLSGAHQHQISTGILTARCDLGMDPGAPFALSGGFTLRQLQGGPLEITANIAGFPPGPKRLRGIHIHESGNIANGCAGARGHYNPQNMDHGGPISAVRHVGDLGNFLVREDGTIQGSVRDRLASLTGPFNVLNRAIVVHASFDDLGQGGNVGSLRTGNAGARLACCVILPTAPVVVRISRK